jgi:hypothetical protein
MSTIDMEKAMVVMFVSMLIKMVRQWNNVGKKPEKTEILTHEILKNGEVSWTRILEAADHDELVYKLTLKYLRQMRFRLCSYYSHIILKRYIEFHLGS